MIAGDNVRKQVIARGVARARHCRRATSTSRTAAPSRASGNKPSLTLRRAGAHGAGHARLSFAPGQMPGLEHTAYFTPPQASYCNGTHVVEVEVDPMTGGVAILNYTVAHDSGNIINPMIVDGQVQGGVAHGIGNAMFECMKYDEDANPLTTTFQDYLLPASCDVPGVQHRARRDAEPAQSPRRQGRGRRRHHSRAGRDHRRDRGCAVAVRRALRRHAADAGWHRRGATRPRGRGRGGG